MASSQASNLTGLLSNIAGTIGSMGGPGNALVDNVRTLNAPKLDQNDPASMRAYADWAMRNGDQQTAQQYQLAAGQMEQEQGARKAGVDMQQMGETLRKQQSMREAALLNVSGDAQEEARINEQFDNAQEVLVGRMNDLSGQYGLETTGTGALQMEEQRRSALEALSAEEQTASADDKPRIRAAIAGVSSGAISPADALASIEGGGDVTNQWRTAQRYADDYNSKNGFGPDDEGFMSDSEAFDISTKNHAGRKGEIADAIGWSEVDKDQLKASVSDYEQGILDIESAEYALEDVDSAISMISGPNQTVNTGSIAGRIQNLLGIGGEDYGKIQAMGTTAAIEALASFKGATSDFEFSKAELSSFADVLKSEEVNLGTLEVVRTAIEREVEKSRRAVQRGYDGIYSNSGSETQARRITGRMGAVPGFVDQKGGESSIDPGPDGVSVSNTNTNGGAVTFNDAWED
jgi:hypothetical protein